MSATRDHRLPYGRLPYGVARYMFSGMSIDTRIPAFTGTVTRLTDMPLVAADMFTPATLAGLEPDALANINGPSVLRMPDWAVGKQAIFHM